MNDTEALRTPRKTLEFLGGLMSAVLLIDWRAEVGERVDRISRMLNGLITSLQPDDEE